MIGVSLVTAAGLAACGSDDSGSDDAAASTPDMPTFETTAELGAVQAKAEEYGYDCTATPASAEELDKVKVQCLGAGADDPLKFPTLQLFDKADRASGTEVAEAEVDAMMEYAADSGITREDKAADYRTLDSDDVVGSCNEMQIGAEESTNCEDVATVLGLEIGRLDGATTAEERQKRQDDAVAEMQAEADARVQEEQETREREEEQRRQELQTYKGWGSLDDATEQLDAWDISCSEDSDREGKVAFCKLDSVIVTYGIGVDKLDKQGMFEDVSRDEMVSVSDGDWRVMCTPGSEDVCRTVADKTGEKVENGV